jgi:endonuclease/exonuclease/phosphatase family metal-dependent hydrolase
MKRRIPLLPKTAGLVILAVLIYFSGLLITSSISDYRPENRTILRLQPHEQEPFITDDTLSLLSWNIGYAGLGKETDFFYDGGRMVIPPKHLFREYYESILMQIQAFDSIDLILLQEIDTFSSRSYYQNQYRDVATSLHSHQGIFVKNYDSRFVPVPVHQPMGRVVSGLSLFTRLPLTEAEQIVFNENYVWPTRLFMPDRCFLAATIPVNHAISLIVINLHLSAFDDGKLRNAQLGKVSDFMKTAWMKGHYVLAGGDWNMNPHEGDFKGFLSGDKTFSIPLLSASSAFDSSWHISFDPGFPTNRDVAAPYSSGETPTTIIDFFIASPNIEVIEVKTLYDEFRYSDHHPVYLRFRLK